MALATVSEYRSAHIIESSAVDATYTDAEIQQALERASAYFESQCYQPISLTTYVETIALGTIYASVNRHGTLEIYPQRQPIVQVREVAYRTDPGAAFVVLPASSYSLQDTRRLMVLGHPLRRHMWAEVRVTYDAGYAVVPEDVKMAVILVAAHLLSAGYTALSLRDEQVRSVLPSWSWRFFRETVDKYRRRF